MKWLEKRKKAKELRQMIELSPERRWAIEGHRILDKEVTPKSVAEFTRWKAKAPNKDALYFFWLNLATKRKKNRKFTKYSDESSEKNRR